MKIRRIFATILCLALVLSMSVVAFAAVTHTLVNDTYNGYNVVGTASTTTSTASAKLKATATSTNPNRPAEDCTSYAKVAAYTSGGRYLGSSDLSGTTSSSVSVTVSDEPIGYVNCTYSFCGKSYGTFKITP